MGRAIIPKLFPTLFLCHDYSVKISEGSVTKNKWFYIENMGLSWSWSYVSWINLCSQYRSITTNIVSLNPVHGKVYSIQHYVIKFVWVCQWLATGRWFSLGTLVSSNNKTDCHVITDILLKVALNTITIENIVSTSRQRWETHTIIRVQIFSGCIKNE